MSFWKLYIIVKLENSENQKERGWLSFLTFGYFGSSPGNEDIKENENEEQYIWRVAQAKDNGLIDMSWDKLAEKINEECRESEDEYYTESAYRKPYNHAKRFYEAGVFSKFDEDGYVEKLDDQKRELEKAKIAFRDERNGWNKQNRIEARIEEKLDNLERSLQEIGKVNFVADNDVEIREGDNSLIVM